MNFVNRQMKGEQWNIHEQTFFLVICVVVMFWRNGTLLLGVGPCAPRVLSAAVLGAASSAGALMYPCAAHGAEACFRECLSHTRLQPVAKKLQYRSALSLPHHRAEWNWQTPGTDLPDH